MIADYILPDGSWNWGLLSHLLPDYVCDRLRAGQIISREYPEEFFCGPTASGMFSTASECKLYESSTDVEV